MVQTATAVRPCLTTREAIDLAREAQRHADGMGEMLAGAISRLVQAGYTDRAKHAQGCIHCRVRVNLASTEKGGEAFNWSMPAQPVTDVQVAQDLN